MWIYNRRTIVPIKYFHQFNEEFSKMEKIERQPQG